MANKTSSTHRSVIATGEHRFTVAGHSLIKGHARIISESFRVGDHDWAVHYYPNGDERTATADGNGQYQYTAVFLGLKTLRHDDGEVTVSFSFCLEDPASPAAEGKNRVSYTDKFSRSRAGLGAVRFTNKADLAASGCLKDDRLVIKCTVDVVTSKLFGDEPTVVVPPSDLNQQLGGLLKSGLKADITFQIGRGSTFKAHACVLAVRSPVFRAQLCGSMMESRQSTIRIQDVSPGVFEALLHFMYNDALPEKVEGDANMLQHLLVAADRYAVDRLKLICESELSKKLDVDTVGFILEFSEQHHCRQLRACCLSYMVRNPERLRAIRKTEGFKQLIQNYPLTACEIIDGLLTV